MKQKTSTFHPQLFFTLLLFVFTAFFSNSTAYAQTEKSSLDELFASLKVTTDELDARKLENDIWLVWLSAENDEIDSLINDAFQLRREFNLAGSLELLNQIIEKAPEYAEAWNQRAITHFYQNNLSLALSDIDKVLELENLDTLEQWQAEPLPV